MKLKRQIKGKDRDITKCAAYRCASPPEMVFDVGVKFDVTEGKVPLCTRHLEERDEELDAEKAKKAKTTAQPGDTAMVAVDLMVHSKMQQEHNEVAETLDMLRALSVDSQEQIDFANECLGDVKKRLKVIKDTKTKTRKPVKSLLDTVDGWFKWVIDCYSEAEKILKDKIRDGTVRMEARRNAHIAAASQAHQAGDMQAVQSMVQAANQAEVHLPSSVSMIEAWKFRVDAPDLVPRALCSPDEKKIRAYVNLHKAGAQIPGVSVWREDTVTRRGT